MMAHGSKLQGALTGMGALAHKRNFLKGLTCWVVSFVLVFSLFATPAYAADLGAAESESTPTELETSSDTTLASSSVEAAPVIQEEEVLNTPAAEEELVDGAEANIEQPADEQSEADQIQVTVEDLSTDEDGDEEGALKEAPFTVDATYTFDGTLGQVLFTITVANPSNVEFSDLAFDINTFTTTAQDYTPYTLSGLPETFDLAAHETRTFTAAITLSQTDLQATDLNGYCSIMVAQGSLSALYDLSFKCAAPKADYAIDITSELLDAQGSARPVDALAIPGDMVRYTFTVYNNGTAALTLSAAAVSAALIPEGNWASARTIEPGEAATFVGTYLVTEADDADNGGSGVVEAVVNFTINGQVDTQSNQSFKVAKPSYAYTINFYADSTATEPLGTYHSPLIYGPDVTIAEEVLNRYLPEGYGAKTAQDAIVATLSEDANENTFDVVYQRNTYGYTIRYFVDSTDSMPVATVLGQAPFGETVKVAAGNEEGELNYALPTGYTPLEQEVSFHVAASSDANTIDIVYAKKNDYTYTIKYYLDSLDSEPIFTTTDVAEYGTTIQIDEARANEHLPEQGYYAVDAASLVITDREALNTIDIVYQAMPTYGYSINYYIDSADPANLVGSEQGSGYANQQVSIDEALLNAYLPEEGFVAKSANDASTLTISENELENTFDVVYQRESIAYTINYYLDSDSSDYYKLATESQEALYGSTVRISQDMLNLHLPEAGYEAKSAADEQDLFIAADPANNTINVVYQRARYPYTVNYYKDSADPSNLIDTASGTGIFGHAVYNIDMNLHLPEGYQQIEDRQHIVIYADPARNVLDVVYQKRTDLAYTVNYYRDSIDPANLLGSDAGTGEFLSAIPYDNDRYLPAGYTANPQFSGATTISVDPAANVMNVVYTQRSEYAYTVNYYKDSVSADNLLGSDAGMGAYQSNIPYNAGAYLPEGYSAEDLALSGAMVITTNDAQNVLNVVYAKETHLSYTVNYYADALGGQLLGSVTGYGTFGDAIPYVEDAYLPTGYVLPAQVMGETTIGADGSQNVLNIVYAKGSFAYTVNYYKDSISADNLLGTEEGSAAYLSTIPYTAGAYVPEGYSAQGAISGSTIIGYDAQRNVLNVVYQPDRFDFTVNYYQGSISEENLIASTQESRLFGSTVTISADELNEQLPQGFTPLTQGASLRITSDSSKNVLDVVFYPNFEDFYAAGIDELNATYNGSKYYLAPKSVLPGDVITYSYNGTTQTRVVGVDDNIGAEFQEVTDGSIPLLVTLTRAGITSNALQTSVTIAPYEIESPGVDGGVSSDPSDVLQQPGNAANNVVDRFLQWVNPVIAVPTPSYNAQLAANEVSGDASADDGVTIEDDLNPLASSPLTTKNLSHQGTDIFGIMLLILATFCAAAAFIVLAVRKRRNNHIDELKGTALAVERVKISKLAWYATILSVAAVLLYVLWVILRI